MAIMSTLVPAAMYVRMSTEHQQYSTENQGDAIRQYAARRGFEVVRTFADAGKSGLRIDGRDSLKSLIDTVTRGAADFKAILVYDVSRWGRFQDADESAYYEYICKRAGITVQYCAEQFENDGSISSNIVKTVKRAMAGEYSRELSVKVFQGQCRLIENGFRQGGAAGFGLRRMLVDQAGQPKGVLAHGEQKSIQTDRVILVPGPPEEVAIVRHIYRLFIDERRNEAEIAATLNAREGARWSRATVHQVLTNEKYIGHNVYNRVSFKLKVKRVHNPPDMWVRGDDAFEAIVEPRDFFTVQGIILERHRRFSNDEMLARLRELLARHGRLSALIIDEVDTGPSSAIYRHRFGSLIQAYQAIEYTPERDFRFLEINQRLRRLHPQVMDETVAALERVGGAVVRDPRSDLLTVNGLVTASIVLARARQTSSGALRWVIRFDAGLMPDLTVAVRMDAANAAPLDYFIFPALDASPGRLRLREENGIYVDAYRFDTLDFFYGIAEQVRVEEVA
jgi:DNA invertase Pin-like site-specific DNA recombinase